MTGFERVERWVPVSARWWRHRAEPLLHERLWGCDLTLPDAQRLRDAAHDEAGFDADGRPIAWRQVWHGDWAEPGVFEIATVNDDGDAVVELAEGVIARTTYDERGLPVRTDYSDDLEPETYEHDESGRLVAIHESPDLGGTVLNTERLETGGLLRVEHDAAGPARIVSAGGDLVWERTTDPWEVQLAKGADEIADQCMHAIRASCQELRVSVGTEVFALMLTYVDQGSLQPTVSFGLEEDRRGWHREGLTADDLALNLLYISADHEGLNYIEPTLLPNEFDHALMRRACIAQTDDPYRAVLGAVAVLLARVDWRPLLEPTADFVVYIAEHDEDFGPKLDSIRAHNPPERAARWLASWPLRNEAR